MGHHSRYKSIELVLNYENDQPFQSTGGKFALTIYIYTRSGKQRFCPELVGEHVGRSVARIAGGDSLWCITIQEKALKRFTSVHKNNKNCRWITTITTLYFVATFKSSFLSRTPRFANSFSNGRTHPLRAQHSRSSMKRFGLLLQFIEHKHANIIVCMGCSLT